jgi:GNAT superfamily N-acetyltransferase
MIPRIAPITALHPGMEALRTESLLEGFNFVDRLVQDWADDTNRFAQPGERFLGAFLGEDLTGIGGLNRDPYVQGEEVGRLRHLYVARRARRRGVASALVQRLLAEAAESFSLIRLRTDTQAASAFYLHHGFTPVEDDTASHTKALRVQPAPYFCGR